MDKVFKPGNMHRLDSDERRKLVPPDAVLDLMDLRHGDTLVDVGAGIGYFAIPAAGRVGAGGKVFAADISQEMLNELARRAAEAGAAAEAVLCDEKSIPLPDAVADRVLLAFALHEVHDQVLYLKEMGRLLKPGGALVIVEWDTVESPGGPPQSERISRQALGLLIDSAGLMPVKDARINEYMYACIVKKKATI